MSDKTGIAWTDATWNPLRGCSRVSEGCRNCYAEGVASRFSGEGMPYHGLAKDGRWTGEVRLVPEKLDQPLRWKKPRRIFVNSMSDLFHEQVSNETIDRVFAVMALVPQHTFQVLTKRPERMLRYLSGRLVNRCKAAVDVPIEGVAALRSDIRCEMVRLGPYKGMEGWPLPNVHLGVSVEDQATADARIPVLLDTPAAVRFVSYEPALGPVDFRCCSWCGHFGAHDCGASPAVGLDWIIVGGESGPRARPCDVAWIRSTVKLCRAEGVSVFVKQLGARTVNSSDEHGPWPVGPGETMWWRDRAGADPAEWPEDLRVQEFPP